MQISEKDVRLLGSVCGLAKMQNLGRKDRRQEGGVPLLDQSTRKGTETLAVPPWSHKSLSTDGHIVHHQNMSFKASSTGMNCQSPHDNSPAASAQCFALAFPDV